MHDPTGLLDLTLRNFLVGVILKSIALAHIRPWVQPLVSPNKNKIKKIDIYPWGCRPVVEHLRSMYEAPG